MNDGGYQIPELPEMEAAYRAAHSALESILPDRNSFVPEASLDAIEVFGQFPVMAKAAEVALAAHLGPRISWRTKDQREFDLILGGVNLDDPFDNDFGIRLDESAVEGSGGDWSGSPLQQAASIYKRECGWDFPPGDGGIWLLMLAPESLLGEDGACSWHGYLVGFVILHDRDKDGTYESVAHMWTARAWRRKGIARRLLEEAEKRYEFRKIEEPLTRDSAAFLKAHPQFTRQ